MVNQEITVWLKNGKYYCWFNKAKRYFKFCYTTSDYAFRTAFNLSQGSMTTESQLLKESESENAILVDH
jgi:hypothetical protein